MISYKALTSASTILEVVDDISLYESEIFSTNGDILYPYDLGTTLTATIFKDFKDVTDTFTDIRWTIFSSNSNNYEFDKQWNKEHLGKNPITITKDEINGKAIIQFEAYKNFSGIPGDDTLVACNRITIVDTNDLLSTGIKPSDPYVGQVWIDSSTEPATMWMWNGSKWVQIGTVIAMVKNLIRNSAFSTYNYQYYDIVGDTILSYTPVVKINNGKKWLNLVSEVETEEHRGIKQITDDTEKIYINSDYSFQFLVYNNSDDSNQIKVNIYSLNSNKEKTLIYEDLYTIDTAIKNYFTSFKTLNDTTNIEVELLGLDGSKYDFCITELALYNTANFYPWEASPYDSEMVYDPEALFNALTYNGKIQGIYSMVNPNTGQIQYYFNAEYIQSGTLKGEYIDAKNLKVTNKDGIDTLKIDNNGNVYLNVAEFRLASSNQTIEEFVFGELDKMTPQQLRFLLYQLEKDHEQAQYEYEQYIKDDNLITINYSDDKWNEFLINEENLEEAKNNTDSYEDLIINIDNIKFNANNTFTIKDSSVHKGKSFILGEAILGFTMLGLGTDDEEIDEDKLWKLLYFTYKAYNNSYNILVHAINDKLDNRTTTFSTFENTGENNIDDDYADYSVKNALLYKLFILCENYITDAKIKIITDDWSYLDITPKEILSEVGSILSAYREDNPDGDGRLISAFGSIANESITANSIINKITEGIANPENKEITEKYVESIIEQTASNINISTDDYKQGLKTSVIVSTNGVLIDSNGSLINMNGNAINISSDNINLEGYVTFEKLASKDPNDATIIDGGYISTNSLDANSIKAGTLSADMITTGTLSNENKTSIFDLDKGTFKLGDKLIYDEEGNLSFSGITIRDSNLELESSLPKWIQDWKTDKTFINGDEVITPRAFIGNYDPESMSGLTGIFLGNNLDTRNEAGEEGKLDGGIVGYYCNEITFRFNVDGTAEFGKDSDRQIKINSDGILEVPTIYGQEISAYNLEVLNKKTNNSTLSINDNGDVFINPSEFYLYNGTIPAISLNKDGIVEINADNITTGRMSSGCLDITDGNFVVTNENGDTTFNIDDKGNILMQPSNFYLTNGSTNDYAISLENGVTNINANYIKSGEINGELIRSESIESSSLIISDAVHGKNKLTKNAIFSKCSTTDEINNGPTEITDYILGDIEQKQDTSYSIELSSKDIEEVFIQVDLKQFYNITASKIYFENNSLIYSYNIKYSLDNINWHNWNNEDTIWMYSEIDKEYQLDINQTGITARYWRLYLNGNNSESMPLVSSLYAWELYDCGATTTIDASGIITGEINANRIKTNSLTTAHINISNESFSFKKNNGDIVFEIDNTDILDEDGNFVSEGDTCVTINPDVFILGNNEGNAIYLYDNELSINASYINSGEINADLIKTGTLDAKVIAAQSITGDKINAKGISVENNNKTTFEVKNNGQVVVDGGSFLIKGEDSEKDSTVQDMIDVLDKKISEYIKMEGDTITLGKTTDDIEYKTIITPEKLAFKYKDSEVAYISNQKMYIENAEIKNTLTLGKNADGTYDKTGYFDFIRRSNGHLSLKWRNK